MLAPGTSDARVPNDQAGFALVLTLVVIAVLGLAWLGGTHLVRWLERPALTGAAAIQAVVERIIAVESNGDTVHLRLRFPSEDYEEEYSAARTYLAERVAVDRAALASLPSKRLPAELVDLARRRVVLDLPKRYY